MRYGDLSLAQHQFQAAVDLDPEYVDGHAYLGHVFSLLGEEERAVQHLKQAIALEPAYVLPRYFLGMHYVRRGLFLTGRAYLEKAHDLDPSNPAICAAVADTHIRADEPQYAVAEQWLRAAVSNAPDDVRFHLLLAHLYVDYAIDPATKGLAVAKFAASLEPENSEAQEMLGWAYHLAGQADLALEALTRARDLSPEEPRIYYRLAEVHRALRELTAAHQLYQKAIDLDWDGPVGERARRAMEQ
jgi:tetratricopeptide (TPR) repeat protein